MYHNDHPPAHFYAEYAKHEAVYMIESLEILRGKLPRRAHAMVVEWALLHRQELRTNWSLAREGRPLHRVLALDE